MRYFKFRVWDGTKQEMIYDPILPNPNCEKLSIQMKPHGTERIFMQETGLQDKNLKYIYEGDILLSTDKQAKVQVLYDSYMGMYRFKDIIVPINQNALAILEIIGNIYENPYLLAG